MPAQSDSGGQHFVGSRLNVEKAEIGSLQNPASSNIVVTDADQTLTGVKSAVAGFLLNALGMDTFGGTAIGGKVASGASQRFENYRPQSTSTGTGNPGGSGAQHAPFGLEVGDSSSFVDTYDPVAYFGYNMGDGGTKKVSAEPYLGLVIEGDYNDGVTHKMEMYFEYKSPDGTISYRPIFFQFDRSKAGAGNTNASLSTAGVQGNPFIIGSPAGVNTAVFDPIGQVQFFPSTVLAGDTSHQVNAKTGFNPHLQLKINDAVVADLRMSAANQASFDVAGHNVWNVQSPGGTGGFLGINTTTYRGAIGAVGGAATGFNASPAAVFEAGSTQTADIMQVVSNGAGTIYFGVTQLGKARTLLSGTASAGFALPHGVAPTSPVDGDMWSTTAGLFIRVNGVTKTVTLT